MQKTLLFLIFSLFIIQLIEATPAQVIIIRHAEKPLQGNILSTKGRERAAALAPFFIETKELLTYGLPIAIYAMQPSKEDPSEGPLQTVTPLADALKLSIKTNFERDNYRPMVDEIMNTPAYSGKMVLICWDHKLIPDIARAFRALQTPGRWPPEAFDRLWIINFASTGKVTFQNLPQRLMYGDSSN